MNELTDRTVAIAKKVLALNRAPVTVTDAPTRLENPRALLAVDPAAVKTLWDYTPWESWWKQDGIDVTLHYPEAPTIEAGPPCAVRVVLRSTSGPRQVAMALTGLPDGWNVSGLPAQAVFLGSEPQPFELRIAASAVTRYANTMKLELRDGPRRLDVPLTLIGKGIAAARPIDLRWPVRSDDLALASRGATAASDSELDREAGCTARVIDGVLSSSVNYRSNRWCSADVPGPHWVEIRWPQPRQIGQVLITFADPRAHPVDFQGLVRLPEGGEMKAIFAVADHANPRRCAAAFAPVVTDAFRLMITRSSSGRSAQISEIEIYPPATLK